MSHQKTENPAEDEATRLAGLLGLDNRSEGEPGADHPARAGDDPQTLSRRKFLRRLSLGAGGVGAALAILPVAGFVIIPLFRQAPETWRQVGTVDQFKKGETVEVKFENAAP